MEICRAAEMRSSVTDNLWMEFPLIEQAFVLQPCLTDSRDPFSCINYFPLLTNPPSVKLQDGINTLEEIVKPFSLSDIALRIAHRFNELENRMRSATRCLL